MQPGSHGEGWCVKSRFPVSTAPHDPLLTVRQVAETLQLSSRTVWRLIDDERLRVVRIGRSVRVHPDALAALIGYPVKIPG
jgi:excisionase family DNA binding protein